MGPGGKSFRDEEEAFGLRGVAGLIKVRGRLELSRSNQGSVSSSSRESTRVGLLHSLPVCGLVLLAGRGHARV